MSDETAQPMAAETDPVASAADAFKVSLGQTEPKARDAGGRFAAETPADDAEEEEIEAEGDAPEAEPEVESEADPEDDGEEAAEEAALEKKLALQKEYLTEIAAMLGDVLGSNEQLTDQYADQIEAQEALRDIAKEAGDDAQVEAIEAEIEALRAQEEQAQKNAETFGLLWETGTNAARAIASGFTDVQATVALFGDVLKLVFQGNEERAAAFQERLFGIAQEIMVSLAPALEIVMSVLEVIAPLLEAVGPLLQAIAPIIKIIVDGIKLILDWVIKPIMEAVVWLINKLLDFIELVTPGKQNFEKVEVPGFASGVRDFSGGVALVGEQGPELVTLPAGSNVYSNTETNSIMNKGGATVNIYSPKALDPLSAKVALSGVMQRMAFEGGL